MFASSVLLKDIYLRLSTVPNIHQEKYTLK